mmetsp:Transcript_35949/g.101208  ORF Transcript_35949/g.101208 Transcript_35949/m.101208 type:complete len:249 (-) Transcript_35949:803-1549(-)
MASAICTPCLTPRTLCTLRMVGATFPSEPAIPAMHDASVPKSRCSGAASPVILPMNPLRLGPRRRGMSPTALLIAGVCLIRDRFCPRSFAKPMPGSSTWDHRGMPAASATRDRSARAADTSDTTSSYCVMPCIVSGVPLLCMMTIGTCSLATAGSMPGSNSPPETSFTMSAPAPTAACATAACRVSIEIGTSDASLSFRMTGIVLCSSTSTSTSLAPGRVDSPPTSMTEAPSPTSLSACSTARSADPS